MRCDEIQMFHVVVFAYVYIYIYIYDTYSLLILKIAGGFPYGLEVGSSHTQLPQKNRGTLPQKRVTFKNNGGDLPRKPPRVSLQTGWETVGPTKIPGKTHGDFRGKIPGPNVALERWRPYKRPKMGPQVRRCFGLKPTEASPLETNQVLPPETKTRPTGPQKSKFKSKRTSNFRVSTVSFRGYELCNWAVIKKIFGG